MTMSKFTVQLRWPVEQYLSSLRLENVEANWPRAYGFIGLDDYPIFDEQHRSQINDKIIRRYYFREIGFETWAQFRWRLRAHMHEVMPYFNDLYEAKLLVTDPLLTRDMGFEEEGTRTESRDATSKRDTTSHTDANSSSTTKDRNVMQDTPMNGLDTGAIEDMDYASNVTFDDGSTTGESESDSTGSTNDESKSKTDEGHTLTHRERGFDRPQSEVLLTYRKALYNLDLEVVESCADLFMLLW